MSFSVAFGLILSCFWFDFVFGKSTIVVIVGW